MHAHQWPWRNRCGRRRGMSHRFSLLLLFTSVLGIARCGAVCCSAGFGGATEPTGSRSHAARGLWRWSCTGTIMIVARDVERTRNCVCWCVEWSRLSLDLCGLRKQMCSHKSMLHCVFGCCKACSASSSWKLRWVRVATPQWNMHARVHRHTQWATL